MTVGVDHSRQRKEVKALRWEHSSNAGDNKGASKATVKQE